MNTLFLRFCFNLKTLIICEAGQDLPEYAFVVVMIALGSVAGFNSLATGISIAFNNVSSDLAGAIL
jgi:Flp pilus assembly pilin Flp